MKFEWDNKKSIINLHKHHVSFETAKLVFNDPFALMAQDRIENYEYRWQTLGMVGEQVLLLVAHTVNDTDGTEIIRIISARRANKQERRRYEDAK
jgi:uncharacterized DUF497 family protein